VSDLLMSRDHLRRVRGCPLRAHSRAQPSIIRRRGAPEEQ
jgi:hypothetical protein